MLRNYDAIAKEIGCDSSRQSIIDHLDSVLPNIWHDDYLKMTHSPNLLTVTFGDGKRLGQFCRYMFDHASAHPELGHGPEDILHHVPEDILHETEDRVVAVWGTSRYQASDTRDQPRMKGFLRNVWARNYGSHDRGHFFAHTMGGGLDINLFPQLGRINRTGLWREMETYCSSNPGTFCFVRPLYVDQTWRPRRLEYGIFKMALGRPPTFWGNIFEN